MNLIRKGSSEFIKVGKSISITNKLLKEIENRDIVEKTVKLTTQFQPKMTTHFGAN